MRDFFGFRSLLPFSTSSTYVSSCVRAFAFRPCFFSRSENSAASSLDVFDISFLTLLFGAGNSSFVIASRIESFNSVFNAFFETFFFSMTLSFVNKPSQYTDCSAKSDTGHQLKIAKKQAATGTKKARFKARFPVNRPTRTARTGSGSPRRS